MDECARVLGGGGGGVNREERRKCSEVDQPRVKQALGQQVMHATIGVCRDQYWFSCEHILHKHRVKVVRGNSLLFKKARFSTTCSRTHKGWLMCTYEHSCVYQTLLAFFRGQVLIQAEVKIRGHLITWNMVVFQWGLFGVHLLT